MKRYFKQTSPFKVPNQDGKTIEEHFGLASTHHQQFSIAHMIAPPGWSEPFQNPEFDEITVMISGRQQAIVDGKEIILKAGESLLVRKGARVRYANPFDVPAEYWAFCLPAFSMETVHREKD